MHGGWGRRAVWQIVVFGHRQRVDIRAKRDHGTSAGLLSVNVCNQSGLRRTVDAVHADLTQTRFQPERRLHFLKRHLRVLVHVPPPGDQIGFNCAYFGVKHRFVSSLFH